MAEQTPDDPALGSVPVEEKWANFQRGIWVITTAGVLVYLVLAPLYRLFDPTTILAGTLSISLGFGTLVHSIIAKQKSWHWIPQIVVLLACITIVLFTLVPQVLALPSKVAALGKACLPLQERMLSGDRDEAAATSFQALGCSPLFRMATNVHALDLARVPMPQPMKQPPHRPPSPAPLAGVPASSSRP